MSHAREEDAPHLSSAEVVDPAARERRVEAHRLERRERLRL